MASVLYTHCNFQSDPSFMTLARLIFSSQDWGMYMEQRSLYDYARKPQIIANYIVECRKEVLWLYLTIAWFLIIGLVFKPNRCPGIHYLWFLVGC